MFALISPNEQRKTGWRIAQIASLSFEIAEPLFWIECGEEITLDYFYDNQTQSFSLINEPVQNQPITTGTQEL